MNRQESISGKQIVIFTLGEIRYALYLSVVERVVQAVGITLLPKVPDFILGVISVEGQITPVVNVRHRLHLPAHDVDPDDQFVLARTSRRIVALVVDRVIGVRELTDREFVKAAQVMPGVEYIHGLAKLDDELVLICDLDQFLSFADDQELELIMDRRIAEEGGRI